MRQESLGVQSLKQGWQICFSRMGRGRTAAPLTRSNDKGKAERGPCFCRHKGEAGGGDFLSEKSRLPGEAVKSKPFPRAHSLPTPQSGEGSCSNFVFIIVIPSWVSAGKVVDFAAAREPVGRGMCWDTCQSRGSSHLLPSFPRERARLKPEHLLLPLPCGSAAPCSPFAPQFDWWMAWTGSDGGCC